MRIMNFIYVVVLACPFSFQTAVRAIGRSFSYIIHHIIQITHYIQQMVATALETTDYLIHQANTNTITDSQPAAQCETDPLAAVNRSGSIVNRATGNLCKLGPPEHTLLRPHHRGKPLQHGITNTLSEHHKMPAFADDILKLDFQLDDFIKNQDQLGGQLPSLTSYWRTVISQICIAARTNDIRGSMFARAACHSLCFVSSLKFIGGSPLS